MEKYLKRYAAPEAALLDRIPRGASWRHVIVIPACGEDAGFIEEPPPGDGRCLTILVVNEPPSASAQVSDKNRTLVKSFVGRFTPYWESGKTSGKGGLQLLSDPVAGHDILLVDRFSKGRQLPDGGGVGHARKIGADLACALISQGRLQSRWIHCTDADVSLPGSYFRTSGMYAESGHDLSALIYPYTHVDHPVHAVPGDILLATRLYELSLRYYVAGMRFAGSPYAFHTIGSTMAVSAEHYAMVRGFPRRAAAEDFYLLNKLAKVGEVREMSAGGDCESIEIHARISDRVPFGTGAAVGKLVRMDNLFQEYRFYHPAVFECLGVWFRALPAIWSTSNPELDLAVFRQAGHDDPCKSYEEILFRGLKEMGVDKALQHAFSQSKGPGQFIRHLNTWFDAFRTLKLIHYLRDHGAASMTLGELEKHPMFKQLLSIDTDLNSFYTAFSRDICQNSGDIGSVNA